MPKLSNRPPKLCIKKSNGTAYVYHNGKQVYLGKYGEEAEARYREFVARWAINAVSDKKEQPKNHRIEDLFAEYFLWLKEQKRHDNADVRRSKMAAQVIVSLYRGMPVDDFTPRHMESVREAFREKGYFEGGVRHPYSRQYLNKLVNNIRGVFAWGVEHMIVSVNTHQLLGYVRPLLNGYCDDPETEARAAIDDESFEATLPYMVPIYQTMFRLLRITGMRPSELCRMRVCDIDTSRNDGIWLYTPSTHKTQSKGKKRVVALGKRSQALLTDRMNSREPKDYLFTPQEVRAEQYAELRASRTTEFHRSGLIRDRVRRETRYDGLQEHVCVGTLAHVVVRAIERARADDKKVLKWTPYSLRHQVVTEISEAEGPVAAQRVAGHASLDTTAIYDHSAVMEAVRVAKIYG